MSQTYICSVSPRFPENYKIGIREGKWGVEERRRARVANVRPGDTLVFVVGGNFRSIHTITSQVTRDQSPIWPLKNGDPYPYRMDIGPAEAIGSVPVRELASRISFMTNPQAWGGYLQGANGVFNSRANAKDVELIRTHLLASSPEDVKAKPVDAPRLVLPVTDYWWPGLLDQLAALAQLRRAGGFADPFVGAEERRRGVLTGVFTDQRNTPTVVVAPLETSPSDTVISTLYGLSALKQTSPKVKDVNGVIFVQHHRDEVLQLTSAVPNLSTIAYDIHVSLR